jgi:hypothetical protein
MIITVKYRLLDPGSRHVHVFPAPPTVSEHPLLPLVKSWKLQHVECGSNSYNSKSCGHDSASQRCSPQSRCGSDAMHVPDIICLGRSVVMTSSE